MSMVMLIAVIGMLCFMLYRRCRFGISFLKTVIIFVLVAVIGVLGTYVLFFLETGRWGGMSFFGAVFVIPLVMLVLSSIFRQSLGTLTDFVAPCGLLMFAVLKLDCAITGCCYGRILWHKDNLEPVFFPSPIVEMITTLLLIGALLWAEHKGKTQGALYPISLIFYGALRFVLNFFRAPENPFFLGMQKGNIWSLLAMILGGVWLLVIAYRRIDRQYQEIQQETNQ